MEIKRLYVKIAMKLITHKRFQGYLGSIAWLLGALARGLWGPAWPEVADCFEEEFDKYSLKNKEKRKLQKLEALNNLISIGNEEMRQLAKSYREFLESGEDNVYLHHSFIQKIIEAIDREIYSSTESLDSL